MAKYTSEKAARIEARLSHEQKEVLQHAADLCGKTLTGFIIHASQQAANQIIREHQVISLTAEESLNLAEIILNPPKPNAYLKKAAERYKQLISCSEGLDD